MKILFVSDVFPPKCGGAGWAAFYLARALQKKGHTITVVSAFGKANKFEGIKILRVKSKLGREFAHRKIRKFLKKLVKKQEFDLINAHNAIAVRASVNLGVPVISAVHDYWPICYKGTRFFTYKKKRGNTNTWLNCWKCIFFENNVLVKLLSVPITFYMKYRTNASLKALNQSQAIVYNSKFVQKTLSPFVKSTIPSTVWFNICTPRVNYAKVPTKKFSKPTIVFIGKFTPEKGAHLVPKIARSLPNFNFIMIGGRMKTKKPVNLTCIPYLPQQEVFSYMKSADLFIAPALWDEPFGRIVVEAMAMGSACVVSKRGGMASDIIKNNKNGILVDPPSPQQFAKHIQSLLKDKKRLSKLKKQARKDFLARFNESVAVKQFTDIAKETLSTS